MVSCLFLLTFRSTFWSSRFLSYLWASNIIIIGSILYKKCLEGTFRLWLLYLCEPVSGLQWSTSFNRYQCYKSLISHIHCLHWYSCQQNMRILNVFCDLKLTQNGQILFSVVIQFVSLIVLHSFSYFFWIFFSCLQKLKLHVRFA